MSTAKTQRGADRAVLIHDGAQWLIYPAGAAAPVATIPGALSPMPHEIPEQLQQLAVHKVRLLVSGEVCRPDVALPPKLSFSEISALVTQEVGDLSGDDASAFVCAGTLVRWPGTQKSALLAGIFDRERIAGIKDTLTGFGIVFDGVASLEMACMQVGAGTGAKASAMLIVGIGSALAVPFPKSKPAHDGPQPFSGGTRHLAADAEGWTARFRRNIRFLDRTLPLSVLIPGSADPGVETVLREECGFTDIRTADRSKIFADAVKLVLSVRANRSDEVLPLANPYVPRKRFSHLWIILPSMLILLAPFITRAWIDFSAERSFEKAQEEIGRLTPIERRIAYAEQNARSAKNAYLNELKQRRQMAECRRPLAATVQIAYFFCRYAGSTVLLQEITEKQGAIRVRGIYADPEDGLYMNQALTEFAKREDLRILKNTTGVVQDEEGMPVSKFEILIDYSKMRIGGGGSNEH